MPPLKNVIQWPFFSFSGGHRCTKTNTISLINRSVMGHDAQSSSQYVDSVIWLWDGKKYPILDEALCIGSPEGLHRDGISLVGAWIGSTVGCRMIYSTGLPWRKPSVPLITCIVRHFLGEGLETNHIYGIEVKFIGRTLDVLFHGCHGRLDTKHSCIFNKVQCIFPFNMHIPSLLHATWMPKK